jgi:hypothetical protein
MEQVQEHLGPPDIELAGLQIWIHGRQLPECDDYWDGNWLGVTAHCGAQGASVWVRGSIVHLSEIAHLTAGVESLYKGLKGKAELPCMEPELSFTLEATGSGHVEMTVDITPDNLSQKHRFTFEIDQSYLPKLLSDCQAALRQYPIRGNREG